MGEYGYAYRSISIYSTTRNGGTREPPAAVIKKPFVPNGNNYSQDAVTRKKIVPVLSRSYDDPAATGKYPSSGSEDESDDDDRHRRQTNPVRSYPHKVRNHEGSHNPQPFGPIVDRGRQAPQLIAEGRRPIGDNSTINHDGANYVGNKGQKLIGIDPIGNHNYDGANGYGGDRRAPIVVGDPKEGRKSIGINPNNYDGTNGNGGDRRVVRDPKEGYKPIGINPIRSDNYDGTNGYGGDHHALGDPSKGYKPIKIIPIKSDNYGGTNDYSVDRRAPAVVGDPNQYKEGRKPIGGGNIRNSNDGYNNGYGGEKEGRKPIGINPIKNENYDGPNGYGGDKIVNYSNRSNPNGPKITSNWSTAPRQGTQLSEPTNDIDKAMELLKMEAAKRDPQRSISNNDGSNVSPRSIDSRGSATARPYGGNFIQSQSRMSPTRVTYTTDDDDDDYNYYKMDNTGRYGGHHDSIIDSREAEKKFKGTRV